MNALHALARYGFTALDDMFLTGIAGTVVVLFLTFIEDVKTLLG